MKIANRQQIIDTLTDIYNLNITECSRNERYLHHYFTGKIQKIFPIFYDNLSYSKLHPEWATSGKYKKNGKEYLIDKKGSRGFIDFAVGDYKKPDLGIEFKYNKSWNFQSMVFDFMKLMDNNNKIKSAISFSVIYREHELSNRLTLYKLNQTITEFTKRLGNRLDKNRPFLFWIIEIAPNASTNQKQSWFCNNLDDKFKRMDENRNKIEW